MPQPRYIMEGEEESIRLDLKTDPEKIKRHALWAGLQPGMRAADLGCGPGKTSHCLAELVQPDGSVLGVDISKQRIDYSRRHYRNPILRFSEADIREPLTRFGPFDFVWIRFVLEHHLTSSFHIVENATSILRPGGIMCLIDLDYNCLSHYGMPQRLEKCLHGVMDALMTGADFDPYVGRKLYSFLYDLGYRNVEVKLAAHHLIFGSVGEIDRYNWLKKVEIAAKQSGYPFTEYEDRFEGFLSEFTRFFKDPRRFSYTPLMVCRGEKAGSP